MVITEAADCARVPAVASERGGRLGSHAVGALAMASCIPTRNALMEVS